MKKNKFNFSMILIVSAIAGVTFFFSCSKNKEELKTLSQNTHHSSATARYTPCAGVENPDNPYDQAGAAHNAALDYLLDHKGEWVCDNAQMNQKAVELLSDYACTMTYGDMPADCHGEAMSILTDFLNNDINRTNDEMIDSYGSPDAKAFMHQLADDITSYRDSSQVDTLITTIKHLEGNINASHLDPTEKRACLQATSIARYSACYWFQDYTKPQSDWNHCPDGGGSGGTAFKINWKKVAAVLCSDALGAYEGSPGGPWGSVIVGGLSSAITALS